MLIRCLGCEVIHDSAAAVCPGCGRCPNCGDRRISSRDLQSHHLCPQCRTPYCSGCSRCHQCGTVRTFEAPPCRCGFPHQPGLIEALENRCGVPSGE
ncbi:hypothetical protein [Planctomyces sp. SH-PL14]|uniref:hypothetical protein n=1 Tax=Planctomyces sp. SH-PL14 TaxID=1632864 RepID=UPI0012E8E12A|nr:hypothetical protein [Planctomyces sp. SH-PL14]